jgi:translation initiation factor RLI1
MGENGTGKTTFCKMLAGAEKPDSGSSVPRMNISMKPQKITPKFQGTVRQLFFKRIKAAFLNPQFQTDVYKPLRIDDFIDQEVQNLSGGELQRVAIVLALGIPADIYLIDEPSAYLDAERRCSSHGTFLFSNVISHHYFRLLAALYHYIDSALTPYRESYCFACYQEIRHEYEEDCLYR